jgi:hypothetical protein
MQQAQSLSGPASASCGVIRETPVEKCFVFLNSVMLWRNELSAVNLGRFNEYSIDSYQISISQVNFKIELISLCCRKSQSPPISILQAEKAKFYHIDEASRGTTHRGTDFEQNFAPMIMP